MANAQINHCPVCGYGPLAESYSSTQELRWSYDICPCCGCEYGYDDHEQHFLGWQNRGCPWLHPGQMPDNWQLESQLPNIIRPWPPVA
jgi:hypothetical protein